MTEERGYHGFARIINQAGEEREVDLVTGEISAPVKRSAGFQVHPTIKCEGVFDAKGKPDPAGEFIHLAAIWPASPETSGRKLFVVSREVAARLVMDVAEALASRPAP